MKTKLSYILFLGILFITAPACSSFSAKPASEPVVTLQPSASPQNTPTESLIPTTAPNPTSTQKSDISGLDHVNIFLVAVGDNGSSGKLIGCGDSLVPVEISIAPTPGVLRATIEELLKLEGESQYGQSGLYNALSLSSLALKNVYIVKGTTVIELTGSLIYGGECDIPRIEEQLTALAAQFSTVKSVTIFVNDEPLEKLLDLRR